MQFGVFSHGVFDKLHKLTTASQGPKIATVLQMIPIDAMISEERPLLGIEVYLNRSIPKVEP